MSLGLGLTAKKIINKAQVLLQERGYQFLSFQDLADSVGIRKASVHHHFKTKEDLARVMVLDYRKRLEAWIAALDSQSLDPRAKLRAYFEMFAEISRSGKSVCPGGSLLLDWNNFSKPVRIELQGLIDCHRSWLVTLLEESIKARELKISKDKVAAHALFIGASIQGGLQLARASDNPEKVLKSIFRQIEAATFTELKNEKK
ncbi:MAG: TetR/AcrR family transcriptional regulator [Bdellovibrionota bacterium]